MWNWITRLFHRKSYDERNKPLPPLPPSSPTLVLGDATTRVPSQHGIGPEYFTTNTTFNPQRINVPGATQNPTVRNNSNAAYSIPQRPSQTIQDQQYSLYPRSQVQFSDSMQWTYPDYHYQPPLNDPRFNFNHIYPHGLYSYPQQLASHVPGANPHQTPPPFAFPHYPTFPPPSSKVQEDTSPKDDVESETSDESTANSTPQLAPTTNDPLYPPGNIEIEVRADSPEASLPHWKSNQWVWHSCGNVNRETSAGMKKVELRKCQGVYQCPQCHRLTRPGTDLRHQTKQKSTPCYRCRVYLVDIPCHVESFHYSVVRKGVKYLRWQQVGSHPHPQPPLNGRLTQQQSQILDDQVLRRPDATVHQHRVGNSTPGSVPLHEISPALTHPRKARYQVDKSKNRMGLSNPKGGLNILRDLGKINNKLGEDFLIDSSLHGPTYLVFQTAFMRERAKDVVMSWTAELDHGLAASRHGFVTDGDHSFFKEGVLLVSCGFNSDIEQWIPVLYTWIAGQDAEHHRIHFRHLFQRISQWAGDDFASELLLNVMDFSGAQLNAHAEEYADTLLSRLKDIDSLSPEAREIQRQKFYDDAKKYTIGCVVHFNRSVRRVKKLIATEQHDEFDERIAILLGKSTTQSQFKIAIQDLRESFRRLKGWLDFWERPRIAAAIFPASGSLDPELASRVPSTTNAAENSHSRLQHSSTTQNDLLHGIEAIFRHVKELEARFNATEAGHVQPGPLHEKTRGRGSRRMHENDGRAPDTAAALDKYLDSDGPPTKKRKTAPPKKQTARSTKPPTRRAPAKLVKPSKEILTSTSSSSSDMESDVTPPMTVAKFTPDMQRQLGSYIWDSNSCFYDHGQELLYQGYIRLTLSTRETMKTLAPHHTFLSSMLYHFDRRISAVEQGDQLGHSRALFGGQSQLRHHIYHKWKLHAPDSYGTADWWPHHALTEGIPEELLLNFRIRHSLVRSCSSGHRHVEELSLEPLMTKLYVPDVEMVQNLCKKRPTMSDYFTHYLPRHLGGPLGFTPLHRTLPISCTFKGCNRSTHVQSITTCWPRFLHIKPADAQKSLSNPEKFQIPGPEGEDVHYELVGRVLWHGLEMKHYSAHLMLDHVPHIYNDMERKGMIRRSPNKDLFTSESLETCYYLYFRSSDSYETSRSIEAIGKDYAHGTHEDILDLTKEPLDCKTPTPPPKYPRPFPALDFPNHSRSTSPFPDPADHSQTPVTLYEDRTIDCLACGSSVTSVGTYYGLARCETCLKWSHIDCLKALGWVPLTFNPEYQEEVDMSLNPLEKCPKCSESNRVEEIWNSAFVGQYALFKPQSHGEKLYPACVVRRTNDQVELEWYQNNLYSDNDSPPSSTSLIPLETCIAAFTRDFFSLSKNDFGNVRWPMELSENAADHGYRNNTIEIALGTAYSCVRSIIHGDQSHLITELFRKWLEDTTSLKARERERHTLRFPSNFTLPLLPGDVSLMEIYLSALRHEMLGNPALNKDNRSKMIIAEVLFSLVILRVYLDRQPEDDEAIFHLSHKDDQSPPRISRPLFLPEQVKLSHQSLADRRIDAPALESLFLSIEKTVDPSVTLSIHYPIAYARTASGDPFTWNPAPNSPFSLSNTSLPPFVPDFSVSNPLKREAPTTERKQKKQKSTPANVHGQDYPSRSQRTRKQTTFGPHLIAQGKRSPKDRKHSFKYPTDDEV